MRWRHRRQRGNMLCQPLRHGILPSLFDAEVSSWITNTTRCRRPSPMPGAPDGIRNCSGRHPTSGFGKHIFAIGEYFQELLAPYPKLTACHIYPGCKVDGCLRTPLRSDIFLYIHDADLMHALHLGHHRAAFMRRCKASSYTPPIGTGILHRGAIILRDDSAMNLPDMFAINSTLQPTPVRHLRRRRRPFWTGDHFIPI